MSALTQKLHHSETTQWDIFQLLRGGLVPRRRVPHLPPTNWPTTPPTTLPTTPPTRRVMINTTGSPPIAVTPKEFYRDSVSIVSISIKYKYWKSNFLKTTRNTILCDWFHCRLRFRNMIQFEFRLTPYHHHHHYRFIAIFSRGSKICFEESFRTRTYSFPSWTL